MKKSWMLRPLAWIAAFVGVLGIQLAGYLMYKIGVWMSGVIQAESTGVQILLILLFGGTVVSELYYATLVLPAMIVTGVDMIYPSKAGGRYLCIGLYELVGCGLMIYAGILGAVKGGPMFWFYARFGYIAAATIVMMVVGRITAMDRLKDEPQATPTPKPAPKPREKMEPWVIWCVIAMIAAAGLILGAGMLAQKQDRELEEAKEAAYFSGYSEGYNTGVADEKAKAKNDMSPNGLTVKRISDFVGQQYGLTPHEAANIISQYNHPGKDGAKPSWDEYMNAIWALSYAGTLIGY